MRPSLYEISAFLKVSGSETVSFYSIKNLIEFMKTVFHINSGDSSDQSELLANIQNLMDDESVEVESISVVVNSNAIDMVGEGSKASEFIQEFIDREVEFNACSNSMENIGLEPKELIEGVKIVDSGVGRLNELQEENYHYIKI